MHSRAWSGLTSLNRQPIEAPPSISLAPARVEVVSAWKLDNVRGAHSCSAVEKANPLAQCKVRNDPNVIRAYLGEEEDAELPPEIAADLARDGPS